MQERKERKNNIGYTIMLLLFLCILPPILIFGCYYIWELPYKGQYEWRIVQSSEHTFWAEYQNIFKVWRSYLTWDNTGWGVPWFSSYDDAKQWINNWKKSESFQQKIYSDNEL